MTIYLYIFISAEEQKVLHKSSVTMYTVRNTSSSRFFLENGAAHLIQILQEAKERGNKHLCKI